MTTQNEIIEKLDLTADQTVKVKEAYEEVLVSEGEKDVQLYDGTTTPNLNKRLAGLAQAVKSVNGEKGDVVITREDLNIPSDEQLARQTKEDRFVITESGRTQRSINQETISVEDFGGKANDPNFDNAIPLQKALLDKRKLRLTGFYYTTAAHYCYTGKTIEGTGTSTSGILKTGNSTTGLPPINWSASQQDKYNVDCVLAIVGQDYTNSIGRYANEINFSNFKIERADVTDFTNAPLTMYGLYAPRVCRSTFYNFHSLRSGIALMMPNPWMVSWIRCEGSARIPFVLGSFEGEFTDPNTSAEHGGTSNTLVSCWSRSAKDYGYILGWMAYTNLISCGGDGGGTLEKPLKAMYYSISSQFTMSGCGAESLHGRLIYARNGSYIDCTGLNATSNVYGTSESDAMIVANSVSTINIKGGRITANSISNKLFSSRNRSTLNITDVSTQQEITGFTQDQGNTDKSLIHVAFDNAQCYYKNGTQVLESNLNQARKASQFSNSIYTTGNMGSNSISGHAGVFNESAGGWNLGHIKIGTASIFRSNGGLRYKTSTPTGGTDGFILSSYLGAYATTAAKPAISEGRAVGCYYFDTVLNKPFWWDGSNWRDANGTIA